MTTRLERAALRRGTAAQWSLVNPVLAAGEEGYETDTGNRKVGDGGNHWNDLSYDVDHALTKRKLDVVYHAAVAGTARPAVATTTQVLWIGSVAPANAASRDIWWDTSHELLQRWTGTAWSTHGRYTYEPIGGESSRLATPALFAKRATIAKTPPDRVKLLVTGSSVASMKYNEYFTDLVHALGGWVGSVIQPGGSNSGSTRSTSGITTNATGGSVTDNTTDFATWWSGISTTFGVGGTRTYGVGGSSFTCDHIDVIYVGGAGGTLGVQVDGGAVVNIDTSLIATGTLGFYTVTPTRGAHTVTVSRVAGTPKVIGVGMWDSTLSGLLSLGVSQGGINLFAAAAAAWTNYTAFLAHYLPDVITWEMKGGQFDQTSLNAMLTAIQAGVPNADVILIGSTPDSTGLTTQVDANLMIQTTVPQYQALGLNALYFDGFTPLGSWARVNALGWGGDGTHLAWQAQQFLATLLMRDLGVYQAIGGNLPFKLHAASMSLARDNATADGVVAVHRAEPTFGFDEQILLSRYLSLCDKTGATERYRFSGNGTSDFMPNAVRLGGSTGPFVNGDSQTQLSARRGDVTANGADLTARSFASNVQTVNAVSGAVTVDLSAGSVIVLNLTGNVTSIAFSNLGTSGQDIELHVAQDATGGRTVSGWSGSVRTRSGFALGSAASKRSVVKFRQISGGLWQESVEANDQ